MSNKRVLIANNDPVTLVLLTQALRDEGYEVDIARDAGSLMSEMEQQSPSIILLDQTLPDVDMAEVGAKLNLAKVFLLSTSSETTAADPGTGARISGCLQKPLQIQEVISTIKAS